MEVARLSDVAEFARRALPYLLRNEAAHCLPIGLLSTLAAQPGIYREPPYLALITEGPEVRAVALRTPPYNLIVSLIALSAPANIVDRLVDDLRAVYGDTLPGVLGPAAESLAFAEAWRSLTGEPFRPGMKERIYQLDTVIPVVGVPGRLRRATEADRPLLEEWLAAFFAEAVPGEAGNVAAWVTEALGFTTRGVCLWEAEGKPVSLAGHSGPTPNGMRIGPVYTPPRLRGHGYASAITAALSQLLLDQGRRFCFLFTNLANPTSNKIYQAIGYRPVIDVDIYEFGAARQENP
ncbi:MAG TPA: GNAT family N-acetyltransferase [Ktedonobacterales bacterium]|nr:GNAT family N-acetyltransferase [Ktedonobacterales bacterium]